MGELSIDQRKRRHDEAVLAAAEAQASGRFGLALALFEEALEHAEALDTRRLVHAAKIHIASCYLSVGDYRNARAGLAAIILESDNPRHVAAAAGHLAEAFMKEGRLERAAQYVRVSLENARLAEDAATEAWALITQGHLAVLEGRHEKAVEHYAMSLRAHEGLVQAGSANAVTALCSVLDNLGYAELLAGHVGRGLRTLRRGLLAARKARALRVEAEVEKDLAFGFLLGNKNAAAERHALRALALAHVHEFPAVIRNTTFVLMEVSLRLDRGDDFERYFERLQAQLPEVTLSRDFFRIFDISDVVNLKEF